MGFVETKEAQVVNNSVQSLLEGGGVVVAYDTAKVSLLNSTLLGNHGNLGGVALVKGSSQSDVHGSLCRHNFASDAGGCIMAADSISVKVSQSKFFQNNAKWGGAIESDNLGSCTISNSAFVHNAAQSAGVVYVNDMSNIVITNSTFHFNTAFEAGGVVFADDDSKLVVKHSNFSDNVWPGL
jgi:hypothetical protein